MYGPNARRETRVPISAPSWLVGARPKLFPCTLLDMSSRGARIQIAGDLVLPAHFALCFTEDCEGRELCRLVWRKGHQAGVRFLAA